MLLAGRNVWITGASGGIGRAVALAAVAEGARVVVAGRNAQALAALVDSIRTQGGEAWPYDYDAGDAKSAAAAFARFAREQRSLQGLVYCAGVMPSAPIGMITDRHLEEVFRVNTFGFIQHLQLAARLMGRGGGGSIVGVSSIVGRRGASGQCAYAASKAAVTGAALSASAELASKRIRVNVIEPGFIATSMTANLPAEVQERTVASIRMARAGQPEDVAGLAMFLLSDRASYMTGQAVGVDGGMVI
jgi:3-oxoacyl-[acyl-carrier protein] reductase